MMSENAGRTSELNTVINPIMCYARGGSSAGRSSNNDDRSSWSRSRLSDGSLFSRSASAAPAQAKLVLTDKSVPNGSLAAALRREVSATAGSPCDATAARPEVPTEAAYARCYRMPASADGSRDASVLLPPPPPLRSFTGSKRLATGKPPSVSTSATTAFRNNADVPVPRSTVDAATSKKRSLLQNCDNGRRHDSVGSNDSLFVDMDVTDVDGHVLDAVVEPLQVAERLVAAGGNCPGELPPGVIAFGSAGFATIPADVDSVGCDSRTVLASSRRRSANSCAEPHVFRGFAACGGNSSSSDSDAGERRAVRSASLGRADSSPPPPPEVEEGPDDCVGGGSSDVDGGDADFADFYGDEDESDAWDVADVTSFVKGGGDASLTGLLSDDGEPEKKRRRGKCGRCPACQIKVDCGQCRYCVHKRVLKQSCLMRKCRFLIHKDRLQRRASRPTATRGRPRSGSRLSRSLFGSGSRQPEAGRQLEHPRQPHLSSLPQLSPPPLLSPLLPPSLLPHSGRPHHSPPQSPPLHRSLSEQSRLSLPLPPPPRIPSEVQAKRETQPMPTLHRTSDIAWPAPSTMLCPDSAMTVMPYHAFVELPLLLSSRASRRSNATAASTAAAHRETDLVSPLIKCELPPTSASEPPDFSTKCRLLLSPDQQQQQQRCSYELSLRSLLSPCQPPVPLDAPPTLPGRRRPRKSKSPRPLRSTPWQSTEAACDEDPSEDEDGNVSGSIVSKRLPQCAEPCVFSTSATCSSASPLATSCSDSEGCAGDNCVEQANGALSTDAIHETQQPTTQGAAASLLSPLCLNDSYSDGGGDDPKTRAMLDLAVSHPLERPPRGSRQQKQEVPRSSDNAVLSAPNVAHSDSKSGRDHCRGLHEGSGLLLEIKSSAIADDNSGVVCSMLDVGGSSSSSVCAGVKDVLFAASTRFRELSEVGGNDGAVVCAAVESHGDSGVSRSEDSADVSATEGNITIFSRDGCAPADVTAIERPSVELDVSNRDFVDVCPGEERLSEASRCSGSDAAAVATDRCMDSGVASNSGSAVCIADDGAAAEEFSSDYYAGTSSGSSGDVVASASSSAEVGGVAFDALGVIERDYGIGRGGVADVALSTGEADVLSLATVGGSDVAVGDSREWLLKPRNYRQEVALELEGPEFLLLSDDFSTAIFDSIASCAIGCSYQETNDGKPPPDHVASDYAPSASGRSDDDGLGDVSMGRGSDVAVCLEAASMALHSPSPDDNLSSSCVPIVKESTVDSSRGVGWDNRPSDRDDHTSVSSQVDVYNGSDNVAAMATTDQQSDASSAYRQEEVDERAFASGEVQPVDDSAEPGQHYISVANVFMSRESVCFGPVGESVATAFVDGKSGSAGSLEDSAAAPTDER